MELQPSKSQPKCGHMCVFQHGWERSNESFRLLTQGTSLRCMLPFCIHPGGQILLDTLQHCWLYKGEKWKIWPSNRSSLFLIGFCGGVFSLLSVMCCPDASWAFAVRKASWPCIQARAVAWELPLLWMSVHPGKALCLESPDIAENALFQLHYYIIGTFCLFLYPRPPSPPCSENVFLTLYSLLLMLSSSLSWHALRFLGTAALRTFIPWATLVSRRRVCLGNLTGAESSLIRN